MADNQVTYEIRLKDQMTAALKRMGMSVSSLRKQLSKGLAGGLKVAAKAMKGLTVAAGSVVTAAGGVGYAAIRMGQSFLEAASKLEDTQAKFSVVFRGVEEDATQMASTMAEQLGYGEGSVMGFMSTLQDTLVPMGFARDEAMQFSGALTGLAADLASFNPGIRDAEQAVGMLQSTLVGQHRSALNFGVVINENTIAAEAMALGLGDVNGELSEQEKVMVRVSLLMKGTADAQGDAIRTADSYKNSTRALTEALTDLREEMGTKLKAELAGAIQSIGGVDVIISAARVSFEFFARVLTDLIIPTVANLMMNFARFVEGLGGMDQAIQIVSQAVGMMGTAFKLAWDTIKVVFLLLDQGLDTVIFAFEALWAIVKMNASIIGIGLVMAIQGALTYWGFMLEGMDKVVGFIRDVAIAAFQGLINAIATMIEKLGAAVVWLSEFDVVPDGLRGIGEGAQAAAAGLRDFGDAAGELKGGETFLAGWAETMDRAKGQLEPLRQELLGFINESWDELGEVTDDWVEAIVEDVPSIESLFQEIGKGAFELGMDYERLAAKVGQAREDMQDIEIVSPEQEDRVEQLRQHLEALQAPLAQMKASQDEANAAQDAATTSAYGLSDAFNTVGEAADNFARNRLPSMEESLTGITEGAISNFATGLTDAFMSVIDGSASAGEAFTKFAAQFLLQITQMIIQALIFRAIRGAMGIPLADGGVVQGGTGDMVALANGGTLEGGLGRLLPVKGYATGGPIVDSPHVALIGEGKHNEAVVPLPDGRSIPVDLQGAPETQVNISIDAVDGQSVDRLLYDRTSTLRSIITQALQESRTFRGAVARA